MTSFNGHAITYDGIGNPLSYYNGSSYTFTWEGRRLIGAVKGSNTMSFEYNNDGIRTSKTVNGVETVYYVNGGQIIAEKTDTRTIVYIYDASGAPIGMMYRTTSYAEGAFDVFWYEKNLQGDIVAVYNSSGTKLVTYDYFDAWGNFTVYYSNSGATTGAQYNPFRYRGYYYDTDLGMYYLQSRYYDAKICRFISADSYVSTGQGILSTNMYSYCNNNPISCVDNKGEFPVHLVIGGIIGGVIGGVSSAISGGDTWDIVFGTISGVASGVLSASGIGVIGQVIGSASISMLSNAAGQIKDIIVGEEKEFNVFDMLFDGAVAGIAAGFAGNGASYGNTAGINSSWKQLFKKGISNSNARQYFYKTAHNAKKQFVLDALFESTKISTRGTVIIVGKNVLSEALGW